MEELLGEKPRRVIPAGDPSEGTRALFDSGAPLLPPRWFLDEFQLASRLAGGGA
jgi:hypothetical protein